MRGAGGGDDGRDVVGVGGADGAEEGDLDAEKGRGDCGGDGDVAADVVVGGVLVGGPGGLAVAVAVEDDFNGAKGRGGEVETAHGGGCVGCGYLNDKWSESGREYHFRGVE